MQRPCTLNTRSFVVVGEKGENSVRRLQPVLLTRPRRRRKVTGKFFLFVTVIVLVATIVFSCFYPFSGKGRLVREEEVKEPYRSASHGQAADLDGGGVAGKETRYLFLINWDHPAAEGQPDELVPLAQVFGDEVAMDDPEGLVNETAGLAARQMFLDAENEGVGRYVINNAYRTIADQNRLWEDHVKQDPSYGSNPYANPVRAMPGEKSEHITGLALDILAESYHEADDNFGQTPEGQWLEKNAWKYGFILRYPPGKENLTGVIYEPWHYRYVGTEAAREMWESGQCLEEYLQ